jgi:tricorn protease
VWSGRDKRETVSVGVLGAEFEPHKTSGFYRFKKIFKGESWQEDRKSPLTEPGITVSEGEFLIAVEDKLVRYPDNPYEFFENTVNKQVRIKVNIRPDKRNAREVKITPIAHNNEKELYYLDWVEMNRKKVEKATNGRVGYIHVPNTAIWGLEEFGKYFFSQSGKDGLIIDARYNRGGWSPDMFMSYLQRRPLGMFIRRTGIPYVGPFAKFSENMVCIVNEYAGSGGDMFPYYFRELGLGPLIGTTTWGGLIATSGRRLMDGGGVATPVSRFKDMSGVWRIENEGVDPDIPVDDHPDAMRKGFDPQLQKAIEIIKKKLP